MNPLVKKDILNVLHETVDIIKAGELFRLRELSDHVIKIASIYQDKESITIAVTIYSLSKLFKNSKDVDRFMLPHLNNAIRSLEKGDANTYESEIKDVFSSLYKRSQDTKYYIEEVLERAQIKKASKMFELGISMGQVADALGVSLWDLMDYIGKTRIIDESNYLMDISGKLKYAREIFNVK
jgi:hypothetical protein